MIYEEYYEYCVGIVEEKLNRHMNELMRNKFMTAPMSKSELFGEIKPYIVAEPNEKIRTEKRMMQLKYRVGETC